MPGNSWCSTARVTWPSCVETPLFEGHQITLVRVDGEERVWVADPGMCIHRQAGGNLGHGLEIAGGEGRAVLLTLGW